MRKVLVTGAGIAGITCARLLAESGFEVTLIEKTSQIGGACIDEYNEYGINIHKYGPHILRINSKTVYNFLTEFDSFSHFQHKVLSYVDGNFYQFPINSKTMSEFVDEKTSKEILQSQITHNKPKKDFESFMIQKIGVTLYNKFYKGYSEKQWQMPGNELNGSLGDIIPIRINSDDRYFTHKYQGVPLHGYHYLFQNMINHKNIKIFLNANEKLYRELDLYDFHIYTGKLDEFFDKSLGELNYHSARFEYKTLYKESYQPTAVVNYPNDYDFLRITEYRKFMELYEGPYTTIGIEYSERYGVPLYCVPNEKNNDLKDKYYDLVSKLNKTYFVGRLADYQNYDMGTVVSKCFSLITDIMDKEEL